MIGYATKRTPHGWDIDDSASYLLSRAVHRDRDYDGQVPYTPYMIHFMKKDLIDYIRLRTKRSSLEKFKNRMVSLSSFADPDDNDELINNVHHDHKVDYSIVGWVDAEAGYPLGTWLSQGDTVKEVAEKRGVTSGAVSQKRKELYARARALRML